MQDNDEARVTIVDSSGKPMQMPKPTRASALVGPWGTLNSGGIGATPYDAANVQSQRMRDWMPYLGTPDTEINIYRDRMVARTRDLVRNDGWAAGGVARVQDNVVGSAFRPLSKPDYNSLRYATGIKAFDAVWAQEFGKAVEAHWRCWATDVGRYCDNARLQTIPQILRLGFRHKLIDGDVIALMQWRDERVGPGKARYATAVQLLDPDRLSNPNLRYDQREVRGGVKINEHGEPLGYYIRRAHQADWYQAAKSFEWDYVERETSWGRRIVIHDYEHDRAAQHRGGAGVFAPVLERLKSLGLYDGAELDAAVINALFGAYVSSPFDPELVQGALGNSADLGGYQEARADFHDGSNIMLGGARLPQLFPGEKIEAITAARPNGAFAEFQGAMLRNVAAALGISYEQISQDWSKTNYSSARAAILESWKTINRRRTDYADGFCTLLYSSWLEESFEIDKLPLPAGAPDFIDFRTAYSACRWLGPGRGWVDPVKEKSGAMLGMEAGLSTLELEAAENGGLDWEENLDQRAIEIKGFTDRGLPIPSWAKEPDEVVQSEKIGG